MERACSRVYLLKYLPLKADLAFGRTALSVDLELMLVGSEREVLECARFSFMINVGSPND